MDAFLKEKKVRVKNEMMPDGDLLMAGADDDSDEEMQSVASDEREQVNVRRTGDDDSDSEDGTCFHLTFAWPYRSFTLMALISLSEQTKTSKLRHPTPALLRTPIPRPMAEVPPLTPAATANSRSPKAKARAKLKKEQPPRRKPQPKRRAQTQKPTRRTSLRKPHQRRSRNRSPRRKSRTATMRTRPWTLTRISLRRRRNRKLSLWRSRSRRMVRRMSRRRKSRRRTFEWSGELVATVLTRILVPLCRNLVSYCSFCCLVFHDVLFLFLRFRSTYHLRYILISRQKRLSIPLTLNSSYISL